MAKHNSSNCNHPKEMYYSPWCPICDVPQVTTQTTKHINFIQTLRHLEVLHKQVGLQDRLWEYFSPLEEFANHKSFYYKKENLYPTDKFYSDLVILHNFIKEDEIYFDVSW